MLSAAMFLATERKVDVAKIQETMKELLRSCTSETDFKQKCTRELGLNPNIDFLQVAWGKGLRLTELSLKGVPDLIRAKCDLRENEKTKISSHG